MNKLALMLTILVGVVTTLTGCKELTPFNQMIDLPIPAEAINPADFVSTIDNPYFSLIPGTTWIYESVEDDEVERIEVTVTSQTRVVMGVNTVVVRDTVYVDGEKVEDTFDWYAQDRDGNVWYFGEDSTEFEDGEASCTCGSWEAGVDGALPGIIMKAHPKVGDAYRQEYFVEIAEDMARVESVNESVSVVYGQYKKVLKTKEWSPLDPGVEENKFYASGVGLVKEQKVKGGDGQVQLIEMRIKP